ncbi:MAG: amidohydrolase family protein [Planctomycetota bacterium]
MILTPMLHALALAALAQPAQNADHPYETDALREPTLVTGGSALIANVTIHDAVQPPYVGNVLVVDGDIAAIGPTVAAPGGMVIIEGRGKHLAPGVVDTHSHLAIERGINEGTLSITADCDITDVVNPDDIGLYRALAGGVTTIQCLHGSANPIGGRSEVLKLRWHEDADALRFPDAPQGIKFALGENVKRSNWGQPGERFPATRPGVEAVFDRALRRAQEYRAEWEAYEGARGAGEDPEPPRHDVRLDVLVGILEGEVGVHSHCYRADEILMLIRVAERYGFRIHSLQHVLEGYKVAHEIAKHGAGPSTFSDWWAYKQEAFEAIPHNAALLDEAGAVSTVNSDSPELIRHLYHEAAKSIRYAGLDRVRTLALCTINSAKQLRIEDRVGSIEVGKDADLVLLTADPLSIYARVEWTMVDGEIEFQRRDAFGLDDAKLAPRPLPRPAAPDVAIDPAGGDVLALVGGTLHPVSGPEVDEGTLLVQDGRIIDLGGQVTVPAGATVIDVRGKHVWPGIFALNTQLGLKEVDSVRGTMDVSESGGSHPDIRVSAAIHPESVHIPVTRSSGITRSQTTPGGRGPFRGQSAVIRLTGDTWEELLMLDRDMLHVSFPRTANRSEKKDERKAAKEMTKLLHEAREYARLSDEARRFGTRAPAFDSRLEALAPFANGEGRVALHADNAQTILFALQFALEEELDAVLYGCTEGWKVADRIAAAGLPVVVGPVLDVPSSEFDPYDSSYANAAVLHRAGVEIAIMSNDDGNPRNVVDHAGMAVAFGLPWEQAVRAITLDAARMVGLDAELGSLTPGKVADVIVTDGDLLETATRVELVLIDGAPQNLSNKQTRLYERYRERLRRMQAADETPAGGR